MFPGTKAVAFATRVAADHVSEGQMKPAVVRACTHRGCLPPSRMLFVVVAADTAVAVFVAFGPVFENASRSGGPGYRKRRKKANTQAREGSP